MHFGEHLESTMFDEQTTATRTTRLDLNGARNTSSLTLTVGFWYVKTGQYFQQNFISNYCDFSTASVIRLLADPQEQLGPRKFWIDHH